MIKEPELIELLIFDLETSGDYPSLLSLARNDKRKSELWMTKCKKASVKDPEKWADAEISYIDQTALSPEFGRIVCASFLHIVIDSSDGSTVYRGRVKSFYDNEATRNSEVELVLKPVAELLNNIKRTGKTMRLCGHNIKKFDVPFLAKRMIMNGITVPFMLQTWGKKPWEIDMVDTGELWSMGAWDNYASLDLLSCALGVPSPKENMKGEYVGKAFWEEKEYEKIKLYCEEDVKCVARICHKLSEATTPLVF